MFPEVVLGLFFVTACLAATTDKLVQVQVLYRHGDRNPLQTYPTDPYNSQFKEDDFGQLTNAGKQRQYRLGKWLRERYTGFLPERYSYTDIKVVSDDMDRCLMSAATNLAGLYPPKGDQVWNPRILWQPIPIHTNASLLEGVPSDCPTNDRLFEQLWKTTLYTSITEVSQGFLSLVSQKTGVQITSVKDLAVIRDILYIEKTLNLELPSWTSEFYPYTFNSLVGLVFSSFSATDELAKLNVGPQLKAFVENFETATEKMIMYSAHDINVANVVHYLEPLFGAYCPEFASTVILELWQKTTNVKYVKAYLKREDAAEPLKIRDCGVVCELGMFKTVLKDVLVTLPERNKLC